MLTQGGKLPLTSFHVYGGTPPLPCNWVEKGLPTLAPMSRDETKTEGAAGTVRLTELDLVPSATEVAVTATLNVEFEGDGAV